MSIEHVAYVSRDIERLKDFYVRYFGGVAQNWKEDGTDYELYFISFPEGSRLEIQKNAKAIESKNAAEDRVGLGHIAFLAKSCEEVRTRTQQLLNDGYRMRTPPTAYSKDFYESSFYDPDGNIIELSVGPQYIKKEME